MKKIIISFSDFDTKPYSDNGFTVIKKDIDSEWNYKTTLGNDAKFVCGVIVSIPTNHSSEKRNILFRKALEIMSWFGMEHWGYHGGMYEEGETEFFWFIETPDKVAESFFPKHAEIKEIVLNDNYIYGEFQFPSEEQIKVDGFSKAFYELNHECYVWK